VAATAATGGETRAATGRSTTAGHTVPPPSHPMTAHLLPAALLRAAMVAAHSDVSSHTLPPRCQGAFVVGDRGREASLGARRQGGAQGLGAAGASHD
jgi:hypothetical protein